MPPQLKLTELVKGLERRSGRYEVLDVFAWNVSELSAALERGDLGDLTPLDAHNPGRPSYSFSRLGKDYEIRVHPSGVARLSRRRSGPLGLSEPQIVGGTIGAMVGAGKSDLPSMILGFLIGAAVGDVVGGPRRALTVRYDEVEGVWLAYDGPLAKWMREASLEAEAAAS